MKRNLLTIIITLSFLVLFGIFGINRNMKKTETDTNIKMEETNNTNESEVNKEKEENTIDNSIKKPETISETSTTTNKEFNIEVKDGVTYIDGYLIVNKTYPLPEDYIPTGTHKIVTKEMGICQECIDEDAYREFIEMKNDAKNEGLNIWIQSGYRSYNYQKGLYNNYVNRSGKEEADTYSARPGYSEHQSGLAFDLNSISDAFATTKEGIWVNENAYKYGFIIRYPKGKDNITGYKYESWHLRYVGIDFAKKLYNGGDWITLEEYFGITSIYAN